MQDTSGSEPLSKRAIAYYRRRQQNLVFGKIAALFAEQAKNGKITRKLLAARLGRDPSQITRWLSAPGNLELDTISDLLLAMGTEAEFQIVMLDAPGDRDDAMGKEQQIELLQESEPDRIDDALQQV